MKTKSLFAMALTVAMYLVFFILYMTGMLPTVDSILLPLPLAVYCAKNNRASQGFATFMICLVATAIISPMLGITTTLIYGTMGLLLGGGLAKGLPAWKRILNAAIVYAIGIPLRLYMISGFNMATDLAELIKEMFQATADSMPEEFLTETLMETHTAVARIVPLLLPAIFILIGLVISYFIDVVLRMRLKRLKVTLQRDEKLRDFQLGPWLAIIYFGAQIGFMVVTTPIWSTVIFNTFILLNLLFMLQGAIVILTYFRLRKWTLVGVIVLGFMLMSNSALFISLFGTMDALFDYRGRFKKGKTNER